jgi:hypothetical protein
VDSLSQANKYVGINIETKVKFGFGFVLNHNAEQNNNMKATINQLHGVVIFSKTNRRSASHKISHPSFYGSSSATPYPEPDESKLHTTSRSSYDPLYN